MSARFRWLVALPGALVLTVMFDLHRNRSDLARALVSDCRREHESSLAAIPAEAYYKDKADRISGNVVDVDGAPVAGARVAVYDASTLDSGTSIGAAGIALVPQAAESIETDADGQFAITGVPYGAKHLVVSKVGFCDGYKTNVPVADGSGANELHLVLATATPIAVAVQSSAGLPLGDVQLAYKGWLPGRTSTQVRADAAGCVELLAEQLSGVFGIVRADGAVLWMPDSDIVSREKRLIVPETRSAALIARGTVDGPVEVYVSTLGRSTGPSSRLQATAVDGVVELSELPTERLQCVIVQDGMTGAVMLERGTRAAFTELRKARQLCVHLDGQSSESVQGSIAVWQAQEFENIDPLEFGSQGTLASFGVLREQSAFAESATACFDALPAVDGFLLVQGPRAAPVIMRVAGDANYVEAEAAQAFEVLVRTQFPFAPVRLEQSDGRVQVGRTDATGELVAYVPYGPTTAWSLLGDQRISYPVGLWADATQDSVSIGRIDGRGQPGNCVFGFVTDEDGVPVAKAEVYIQGTDPRPRRVNSSDDGYFRFTDLPADTYYLFARLGGDRNEYREFHRVDALVSSQSYHDSFRSDVRLWNGQISLARSSDRTSSYNLTKLGEPGTRRVFAIGTTAQVTTNVPIGEYDVVECDERGNAISAPARVRAIRRSDGVGTSVAKEQVND